MTPLNGSPRGRTASPVARIGIVVITTLAFFGIVAGVTPAAAATAPTTAQVANNAAPTVPVMVVLDASGSMNPTTRPARGSTPPRALSTA